MAVSVETTRLKLVALDCSVLRLVEQGAADVVERELDALVPAGWMQTVPARERLAQLPADATELPWLVRAIVCTTSRRIVGNVGFHAPPDARGRVEIGYDVLAGERRQGYAREAIVGLVGWAFATGRARCCVSSIAPDNVASLALAASLGFCHVGEQIDEIDGVELVYECTLPLHVA